jgi:hypothetical protein
MKRSILALLAALVVWVLIVSLLNRGLRMTLEGYAAAEPAMSFTLGMLVARLTIGAISSLAAGAVAESIAPLGARTPWVLGVILLAAFIPEHVRLWSSFPLWYHLTFLLTLLPLVVIGSRLKRVALPRQA